MENEYQANDRVDKIECHLVHHDFKTWLRNEFDLRVKKNQRFSLRAFARLIKINPSSLSQYMSGKRKPSQKMISKFCQILGAHPNQEKQFFETPIKAENVFYKQIELEEFQCISDWYHVAILELTRTDGFDSSVASIAGRLQITTTEVQLALERLRNVGLIEVTNGKIYKKTKNLTNTAKGKNSYAHKQYQKQVINKSLLAIDECPAELKDITSISMAIDINKIAEARELIRNFRKSMCAFLEDGKQTEVYNMSIQLIPISKTREV